MNKEDNKKNNQKNNQKNREPETMKKYQILGIKDFNLDHIFDCGQCFRWEKEADGSYTGIAFGRPVNMSFDAAKEALTIENADERDYVEIWRSYLDLDRDYGQIKKSLAASDPVMQDAIEYGYGIRLLRQDLWETVVSFIISQNNNIPRIKGCIEKLSALFGDFAGKYRGRSWYNIPTAETMSKLTEDDLAPVRLGYRAKYLISAARSIMANGLPENEDQVLALKGVGPKVASCITLFSMSKYESFPVDVWMARVMSQLYGLDEKNRTAIEKYAKEHFGELGGFAQQYLFYYIRSKS